jgi:hypothetical protein
MIKRILMQSTLALALIGGCAGSQAAVVCV